METHESHWSHLSRFTNLLILANLSLFFLTELVTREGYYYTFYSLFFLGMVQIGLLLPLGLKDRLWYYLSFLLLEFAGLYFLVSSACYWVVTHKGQTHPKVWRKREAAWIPSSPRPCSLIREKIYETLAQK